MRGLHFTDLSGGESGDNVINLLDYLLGFTLVSKNTLKGEETCHNDSLMMHLVYNSTRPYGQKRSRAD